MIRNITREEIPLCADLIRKSFGTVADEFGFTEANAPDFTAFAVTSDQLYWQMDHENRQMYVFEKDEILCGYYSLLIQNQEECELNHLAVLPEYRHQGIGKQLLHHAFAMAQQAGCKLVNIGIVEENKVLRRWYEQNGVIHIGIETYDFFPFTCGVMKKNL